MLRDAARDQQDVLECVARGELEEVRGAALFNRTSIVTGRFCELGDGVDSLEGYIHSLWHMYFRLSQHTSHKTADHDRLVLDILRIQGLGTLSRPVLGFYGADIARTADGKIWVDLPFLVADMTSFWEDKSASMSGVHRLNFASFLAKLAATRVSNDRMCQVALVLFRSTFEDRRDLRTTEGPDDEDTHRDLAHLDIAHLLPAACEWLKEAGHAIIELSDASWHDCTNTIGQGGTMFVESELGKRSSIGFTPWRWMYWLKRLHEIQEEASESNDKHLLGLATDAIDRMVSNVKERNARVLKVYQDAGDDLRQDKHLMCLSKESSQDE